jgi:hypothetical protein
MAGDFNDTINYPTHPGIQYPALQLGDVRKLDGKTAIKSEITPGLLKVSWSDMGKGLVAALVASTSPFILTSMAAHTWKIDWNAIGQTDLTVALMFIGAKLATRTQQITTFKKVK